MLPHTVNRCTPIREGWIGVSKSANSWYILVKFVNPPLFSFKSESAILEKFVWYSFIATNGRCCFLCQFLKKGSFYCLFLRQFIQHTDEDLPKWPKLRLLSVSWHEESRIRAKILSGSVIPFIFELRKSAQCFAKHPQARSFLMPNPSIREPIAPSYKLLTC